MEIYLGVGTGASDRLDLMDGTNYLVLEDGFRVDDDAVDRRYVYITLALHLKGATQDAMLDARRAILTKLNQATIGGTSPNEWVTLGVKFTGASQMVWWHVVEGGITEPGALRPAAHYIGSNDAPLLLTLRCHKGALGTPIVDEAVAITGADPVLYRPGVPGDLPAYVEAVVADTSENAVVLHGIGIGSRSATSMDQGDYAPFQPVEPTGIGSVSDDSDSFTGDVVTAAPGVQWQAMCHVQPDAAELRGRHDLWLRVRDDNTFLDTPEGLTATGVTGASVRQSISKTTVTTNGTITLDTLTLAGNTLVLMVWGASMFGTPAVTGVPAGFTLVESATGGGHMVALYAYPNAPAMSGDLVVTLASGSAYAVAVEEWTGMTSAPVDVSASNTETSGNTHSTGTTATTTAANAVAITMHISGFGKFAGYTDGYVTALAGTLKTSGLTHRYRAMNRALTATGAQSGVLTNAEGSSSANLIAVFKTRAGGELDADTYQYRVAALDADGGLSAAGATVAVYHPTANSATQLEWQPSSAPSVTGYRVYVRKGLDAWVYFDTGLTPSFLHSSMSAPDGTADPPDTGAENSQIRLGFALGASGAVTHRSAVVRPQLANGRWEWLRIASEMLPPVALPLDSTQPAYRVVVETRRALPGDTLTVDAVAFVPADEAWFEADVVTANGSLNGRREWVLGTNPAGHSYAFVCDPEDASNVSGANAVGRLAIGPGDTTLVFLLRGPKDVAVVEDASATVQLTIYPRYHWAAGSL